MSTLVKRLAIGVLLGILAVFAVVGIKSTLQKPNVNPVPNATVSTTTTTPITTTNPIPSTPTNVDSTAATTANPTPPTESPSIVEPDSTQDVAQQPDTGLPLPQIQGTPSASTQGTTLNPSIPAEASNQSSTPSTTGNVVNNVPSTTPQMVDIPAPAPVLGKLQLVLIDSTNLEAKPKGNFIITDSQNVQVAMQQNSDVGIFELPPGTYKATVSINGKRNTRTVQIVANESKLENFTLPPSMSANPPPVPVTTTNQNPVLNDAPVILEGTLQVLVKASGSGTPVRANIYVQKPNGVHVASKTYTTSADFLLEPGAYKITVKAKDRADLVQDIKISQDKATRATFNLQTISVNEPVLKPAPSTPKRPLNEMTPPVAILPTPELNKPVLEPLDPPLTSSNDPRLSGVPKATTNTNNNPEANVPPTYAPGSEVDTVQNPNEAPRIINPPPLMGSLELHAISGVDGQPLPVDFTVTTLRGQIIRRFNEVAIADVAMPAQDVLVHIHYRGMKGTETIHVTAGNPTVYTFTVTPNDADNLTN